MKARCRVTRERDGTWLGWSMKGAIKFYRQTWHNTRCDAMESRNEVGSLLDLKGTSYMYLDPAVLPASILRCRGYTERCWPKIVEVDISSREVQKRRSARERQEAVK